ncbi:hypothetical protein Aple_041360 [Acrocarpospora pleiomorpha]|uniref:Uncharacterized protein n=1 Tax=Acrocarpospora pleiomorpha TaxID=90975 RepID=A0A5M3XJW3_9ACTN|nr:hypothetical protein [Acrocarpospora pleiomorpha]GES21240.1 hypothetical protein Aple_041360 [Acrocarpospora pleiomorpha]
MSSSPQHVKRIVGSDRSQFVELVKAAGVIGLGVELKNAFVPAPEGGYTQEWCIDLYSEPPGRTRTEQ